MHGLSLRLLYLSIHYNEISKEVQKVEAFQSQPYAKSVLIFCHFATDFRVVKPIMKE